MNRDIKFRGKTINFNSHWVYGDLHTFDNSICVSRETENYGTGNYDVLPETIGQYTGLKDKNGVEIYEGDIIQIPDDYEIWGINAGEKYEVYFAYGAFRLKPKYRKEDKGFWLADNETVDDITELEIIGNIYDTPELLSKEID